MMNNLRNCLDNHEIDEPCFNYLKSQILSEYSLGLVLDLISLPCVRYDLKLKLSLMFSLIEDKQVNDSIINHLCEFLGQTSNEEWLDYKERVVYIVNNCYSLITRTQFLKLAHALEIMHAKGYENITRLLYMIYDRISTNNCEFNPDSDENVRIRLAKLAYGASKYNVIETLEAIKGLKRHIENSCRKYLLGTLNYYKGISLGVSGYKVGYKDSWYYVQKASNKDFFLARTYLKYRYSNFETSKDS